MQTVVVIVTPLLLRTSTTITTMKFKKKTFIKLLFRAFLEKSEQGRKMKERRLNGG